MYIQKDATLHSLFISGNCSTCFGLYLHPSSGAHTTVFTASGTCQTVIANCRCRGGVGTGLSVLREQHTQTSTNSSTIATGCNYGLTSARCCRYNCICSWWWVGHHPKHVEQFPEINKLCKFASCWIYIRIYLVLYIKPFLTLSTVS